MEESIFGRAARDVNELSPGVLQMVATFVGSKDMLQGNAGMQ